MYCMCNYIVLCSARVYMYVVCVCLDMRIWNQNSTHWNTGDKVVKQPVEFTTLMSFTPKRAPQALSQSLYILHVDTILKTLGTCFSTHKRLNIDNPRLHVSL